MTKELGATNEHESETDEQLKNLAGFLDMLVQIDLANREPEIR